MTAVNSAQTTSYSSGFIVNGVTTISASSGCATTASLFSASAADVHISDHPQWSAAETYFPANGGYHELLGKFILWVAAGSGRKHLISLDLNSVTIKVCLPGSTTRMSFRISHAYINEYLSMMSEEDAPRVLANPESTMLARTVAEFLLSR